MFWKKKRSEKRDGGREGASLCVVCTLLFLKGKGKERQTDLVNLSVPLVTLSSSCQDNGTHNMTFYLRLSVKNDFLNTEHAADTDRVLNEKDKDRQERQYSDGMSIHLKISFDSRQSSFLRE